MDVGTVLSVAQTLFAALQYSELKEMCSFLGYQSVLDNLKATVATVNAVLLDAEAKRELSHEAQCYIDELKDAIYDADDLIDEFVTRAARKQRQLAEGRKVSEKVRLFFSKFKDLGVAHNLSWGVKEVRQRLDVIASNHNYFGFKLDSEPIRKRREETCSYVYDKDIIGREDDKEKIVGMLLDSNVKWDVSFLTIVGIGGLGKTTLAQLVYNDERVTKYFDLRLWACVSDEDPKYLDVKAVISKILGSTSSQNLDNSSMERLQGQLHQRLSGNKYLLVLDDVWNENRDEWLKLEAFFKEAGLAGSWVVVTTRSKKTAKIANNGFEYELGGLSEEDSWRLFERIAFGQGEDRENTPELAEIGQTIVKKCANVPLAIRVVASLLYGHGKVKWQSFQEISLGEITIDENGMLSILMLSYHNLDSRLKSCFSYCAIFPKDFRIEKKMLISLWMAQGYIVPQNSSESMEDAAEEYFSILLRICFFQDVNIDANTGKISSCTMHDLMHDISQKVAGKEVCVLNPMTSNLDRKTRHISIDPIYPVRNYICTHKIGVRTLLRCFSHVPNMELPIGALFANWVCLRTLDLHNSGIKNLPCSIGNLLHLRYLDLSWNLDLEMLPKSITKLHNLQTFKLSNCSKLIELPNDFSKLVNLWLLDIFQCSRLTHMPPGMGKLNGIQWLTMFVVGVVDQLEDLKALTNLKGKLAIYIRIPKDVAYVKGNNSYQGGYLSDKQWLNSISFNWVVEEREANEEYEAALLDDLQPHPNLKEVYFNNYCGKRLARWMIESNFGTYFSNLVTIDFWGCDGLQHLMSLKKLPHLRELVVCGMMKLEYMEDTRRDTSIHDVGASFFPSLEIISLKDLPELKGWWRDDDKDQVILDETNTSSSLLPSFPCLSHLNISGCPKLTTIPLCPNVKDLELDSFIDLPKLVKLPKGMQYLTCLQSLKIRDCKALESLPEWLPSLTSLTQLEVRECSKGLMQRCQSPTGEDWPHIQHIPSLYIHGI